mgnify:CR=1 FL=1
MLATDPERGRDKKLTSSSNSCVSRTGDCVFFTATDGTVVACENDVIGATTDNTTLDFNVVEITSNYTQTRARTSDTMSGGP